DFPTSPVDLLSLVTAAPIHEERTLTYAAGSIHVDLFHPANDGRHGAIILLLGAGDVPRSDLAIRFSEALARSGVVAMLPQSDGLLADRLTFDEVDGVRTELEFLESLADVDRQRIGIVGLSAAGGLSIVAAGQTD